MIRYRIDGILHPQPTPPEINHFQSAIISRLKIMARLNIAEKRLPQDGRIKLKVRGREVDVRVSVIPMIHGEGIVLRILDKGAMVFDLQKLGMEPNTFEIFSKLIRLPHGIILVTGPTGSGKTTTLYSSLVQINNAETKIITTEDPVEYQLPGINQIQVHSKIGLTFSRSLRSILRHDPDVVLVGEIRDLETAEIAIKASQTGHMVLSTLHTNDAPSTLTRLLNMGIPAFNVASAVNLIVAQRLCRKLCTLCKEPANYPDKVLLEAGFNKAELKKLSIFQANTEGCTNCTEGYKGRSGVFQVMPISETIKTLIMEGCTEQDIERTAKTEGILDLRDSGLHKIREGITSLEEIERVTNV